MNGHVNGGPPAAGMAPSRGVPAAGGALAKGGGVDKAADFANYFCTYAFLYHQKEMLSDRVRMDAYYRSIFRNAKHFLGKTVLDVGTGSGILAIWAAQAGARKVYAVEATVMARHARSLIAGNNVDHIVEVIEGAIEDITIPEKVDIIISEWMGYFLVRESMFDSVIYARDKWLKPTGIMYPSHARMWVAPMRTSLVEHKQQEFQHSMADWGCFLQDTSDHYNVDMSCLSNPYKEEQTKYFLQGSPTDPADHEVELTTAPSTDETTHWGQQVFLLHPPLNLQDGDILSCSLDITRSRDNHRLMDVKFVHQLERASGEKTPLITSPYFIE
ncbi:hypothetical protein AXG93_1862s1300 [Marchantia polymorpha subsp. ruderalis]|uniref:Protein arginine N-methyltransferase domain-containing protein n=1 Tax=Marchantia polymorpha subsp. ruderalis TaxID=1480154 RepID=A0A176W9S9_MARPO|nr:hypothetical protein AXG93_1862s1300 [Marchantia polymorpha subsp. ruderalis]